jgi:hypothetical protein
MRSDGRPDHIEDALVVIHDRQWFTWTDSKNKIYANLRLTEKVGIDGNLVDNSVTELPTESAVNAKLKELQDAWDAANGGSGRTVATGNVLQVVEATNNTGATSTSTSYADTGLTANITPSSTSNKILVLVNVTLSSNNGQELANQCDIGGLKLVRDSTDILDPMSDKRMGVYVGSSNPVSNYVIPLTKLDSPSSTSAVTYKVQYASRNSGKSIRFNGYSGTSTIQLMEISA